MEMNTVNANSVGRSIMKWVEARVGTAFPLTPSRTDARWYHLSFEKRLPL